MADESCLGQAPSLLDNHLAVCNAVIERVEHAEALYRAGEPVMAALELHKATALVRAHLAGEAI
jgi:hypothetical protein